MRVTEARTLLLGGERKFDMSLQLVKTELKNLCIDVQDDLPENVADRIRVVRKMIIKSDQWLEKTAHLQIQALTALWNALAPKAPHEDIRWQINVADGKIEESIRVSTEEWKKGIPKPLKPALSPDSDQDEETDLWIATFLDDGDFITNEDLVKVYQDWMHEEELTPIHSVTLSKKLSVEGFEKTMKKIDGKAQRGWMIRIKDDL